MRYRVFPKLSPINASNLAVIQREKMCHGGVSKQ